MTNIALQLARHCRLWVVFRPQAKNNPQKEIHTMLPQAKKPPAERIRSQK
jgi:hypothetical protein